jgi:hypothetical protein
MGDALKSFENKLHVPNPWVSERNGFRAGRALAVRGNIKNLYDNMFSF